MVGRRNLDLLEEDLRQRQTLDPALVASLATAKADGYARWQVARRQSDFGLFSGALQTLIDLRREQASQLAEPRSCWETLAQPFEPDLRLDRLQQLFAPLRERLPVLIDGLERDQRPSSTGWDCRKTLSSSSASNCCRSGDEIPR